MPIWCVDRETLPRLKVSPSVFSGEVWSLVAAVAKTFRMGDRKFSSSLGTGFNAPEGSRCCSRETASVSCKACSEPSYGLLEAPGQMAVKFESGGLLIKGESVM